MAKKFCQTNRRSALMSSPLGEPVKPIDEFAEHLAEGKTPAEAARLMGRDAAYGLRLLAQLRRQFGEQAK